MKSLYKPVAMLMGLLVSTQLVYGAEQDGCESHENGFCWRKTELFSAQELAKPIAISFDRISNTALVLTDNRSVRRVGVTSDSLEILSSPVFPEAELEGSDFTAFTTAADDRSLYLADYGKGIWWSVYSGNQWSKPILLAGLLHDPDGGVRGLSELVSLELSPDNRWLVALSDTGVVLVFEISQDTGQPELSQSFYSYERSNDHRGMRVLEEPTQVTFAVNNREFYVCVRNGLAQFQYTTQQNWVLNTNASMSSEETGMRLRCQPHGLLYSLYPDDRIYLSDMRSGNLLVLGKSGQKHWQILSENSNIPEPGGIAVYGRNLLVASGKNIWKIPVQANGDPGPGREIFMAGEEYQGKIADFAILSLNHLLVAYERSDTYISYKGTPLPEEPDNTPGSDTAVLLSGNLLMVLTLSFIALPH